MKTTIEVEGLKELEQQLLKLDAATGVRVLRLAVRKGAAPMLASAKRWVPYDYNSDDGYHLRDAMALAIEPKRTRTTEAQYRLGPKRESRGGRIVGGLDPKNPKSPNYAGIVHNKSVAFLAIAFDTNYKNFLSTFKEELAKSIARAIKRQEKKKR